MPREHLLKIGVSGIRGVVGDFLTPGLACAFAQAFGTYVGAGRVVIGRDTRSSGEMLHHAPGGELVVFGGDEAGGDGLEGVEEAGEVAELVEFFGLGEGERHAVSHKRILRHFGMMASLNNFAG